MEIALSDISDILKRANKEKVEKISEINIEYNDLKSELIESVYGRLNVRPGDAVTVQIPGRFDRQKIMILYSVAVNVFDMPSPTLYITVNLTDLGHTKKKKHGRIDIISVPISENDFQNVHIAKL